jgi:hypothetical protein
LSSPAANEQEISGDDGANVRNQYLGANADRQKVYFTMTFDPNAKSLEHLGTPPELLYKYRPVGEYTESLLRGELFF